METKLALEGGVTHTELKGALGLIAAGLCRLLIVFFGMLHLVVGGLRLEQQRALMIFPETEKNKRERGGGCP
jgi:hypothetical protein